MRFDVLTLFPEIFQGYLGQSLLKRAIQAGLVNVQLHNIRDWSKTKHNTVDDRPFGGGPGMVMKVEPVVECVEAVRSKDLEPGHLVMLTPQGRRFDQPAVERLARHKRILLLCGRYEGFDERIRLILEPEEISSATTCSTGAKWPPWWWSTRRSGWCRAFWETKTAAFTIHFLAHGDGSNAPSTRGRGSIAVLRPLKCC